VPPRFVELPPCTYTDLLRLYNCLQVDAQIEG